MMERKEELARLMTREQGKPLKAARNEVQYGADFLLWFAEEAKRVYGETIPAPRPDQRFIVRHEPVGVVGAVTPWNYPVSMITRKVAPAIAAGCTIVLKPAEATPLCAMAIFKIFHDAGIPAGVVNLVTALDPAPIGDEFITNPGVRKLTFTGSTAVGKLLARGAAEQMKRVSLELGGHAPFIVFEDANPKHAATGAMLVKFLNTGQACISPNRIFVHRNLVEAFIQEAESRISRMQAGNGMEDGVSIGPLVGPAALEKVQRQVDDALNKGATLVCGGKRLTESGLDKGYFYAPTLLGGITATYYADELITRPEVDLVLADGEPAADIVAAAKEMIRRHLDGQVKLAPVNPAALEIPAQMPAVDIGHRSLTVDSILVDVLRNGLAKPLAEGLSVEADGFARCKETVDYDIGMKNFIQNGPRVPAVFLHE